MIELTNQLMEVMFGLGGQSCVISKQHFSDEYCTHLGSCPQASQVK